MFGRSETRQSDWTHSTLFTFFNERIVHEHEAVCERMDLEHKMINGRIDALVDAGQRQRTMAETAIMKADLATEKRFESVNEFRKTLSDQTGAFITRNESNAALAQLAQQVSDLKDRLNLGEGRQSGGSQTWVWIIAAIGAIGAFASLLVNVLGIATRSPGITH